MLGSRHGSGRLASTPAQKPDWCGTHALGGNQRRERRRGRPPPRSPLGGALNAFFCHFFHFFSSLKLSPFFAAFPRSGVHACAAKAASVTQIPAPAAKRAAAAENRSPVQTRAGEGRRDDDRHDKPKPRGRPRQLGSTASVDDQSPHPCAHARLISNYPT